MTSTTTAQAPAQATPRRRVDDLLLPERPLEWGDEGTPFESTSVVYFYRARIWNDSRWAEIRTQEHLLDIKQAPDLFELLTLFTVPVDELSRSPITHYAAAQTKLDIINAAAGAVKANLRAFLRETAEKL